MERLSAIEIGKKLVTGMRDIGRKLGRRCLDSIIALGGRLLGGIEWLVEKAKWIYDSQEDRFFPVFRRWIDSLVEWWERRGWPLAILRLAGNALVFLPIDIGWYLLACLEHFIGLNPPYLLAWLVFAGSIRAWRFYFKEILPDQRKANRAGTAENGTQSEGGS
jgi:hypothetical protein